MLQYSDFKKPSLNSKIERAQNIFIYVIKFATPISKNLIEQEVQEIKKNKAHSPTNYTSICTINSSKILTNTVITTLLAPLQHSMLLASSPALAQALAAARTDAKITNTYINRACKSDVHEIVTFFT